MKSFIKQKFFMKQGVFNKKRGVFMVNSRLQTTELQTDVDKLIKLIKDKGRVSITQAARELRVGRSLIEEWADFLEDEGIITKEYKLTDTILIPKEISKEEVKKKEKEVLIKKDSLMKKIENTASNIHIKEEKIEELRREFEELKKLLGKNIDKVHKALKEIEEYNKIKKNTEAMLENERREYLKKLSEIERSIKNEEKRYERVMKSLLSKQESIKEEEKELEELRKKELELVKRINEVREASRDVMKKIMTDSKEANKLKKQIKKLKVMSSLITRGLSNKRRRIESLIRKNEERTRLIMRKQKELIERFKKKGIGEEELEIKIPKKLEEFFERKNKIEELFNKMKKEDEELKNEMVNLLRKMKLLNAIGGVKKEDVKKVEEEYKKIIKKESVFDNYFKKLKELIDGLKK